MDNDSHIFVAFRHGVLDHGVECSEEGGAADEHVYFYADGVEHTRHFDGDISRSYDSDFLGKDIESEEAVVGNSVGGTGDVCGDYGVAASGNADLDC